MMMRLMGVSSTFVSALAMVNVSSSMKMSRMLASS